jgi:hypothetical protein
MPDVNFVVPTHDAILPFMFKGIKWAVPNVGDNQETHNLAIARLFEKVGEHLQALSNLRDCFMPGPPSITAIKAHHNMFVRLNNLIDTNVKTSQEEHLVASHVNHERRKFKIYPVRYYDVKNDYLRRWIELCLQGLSNMAQLTDNGWQNDYNPATAVEMKKLFREAYRLMVTELFNVDIQTAKGIFNDVTPFYLTPDQVTAYDNSHIPTIEWMKHPNLGLVLTEDEMRSISTPNVQVAPGVAENDPNTPQRDISAANEGVIVP